MNIEAPEQILSRLGDTIAAILQPDTIEKALTVTPLKSSETSHSFKISLGNQQAVVKVFTAADDAFDRERRALEGFQGEGVAKILFVSEQDRLVMCQFIHGRPMNEVVEAENLIQMAEFLGQWFGRLSTRAPQQAHSETWASYLSNYEAGFDRELLAQHASLLERPVSKLILCHNDNALSNFILGKDRHLYGIDYENCQMKPEGWDLVMAAKSLFRRFPENLQEISTSLLRGYQLTIKNSSLPTEFDQVLNVLVVANIAADT